MSLQQLELQISQRDNNAQETSESSFDETNITSKTNLDNKSKPTSSSMVRIKFPNNHEDSDDYGNTQLPHPSGDTNKIVIEHQWIRLFTNCLFWSRIFILFFSIFVLILSVLYSLAQLVTVELDLITSCDQTKTPQEIWQHSYETSLENGGKLDENAYESQVCHINN